MQEKLRQFIKNRFADGFIREDNFRDELSFYLTPEALFPVCEGLLEDSDLAVKYLADITSLDWLGREKVKGGRYEVVYNLLSLKNNFRFFLKVMLPNEDPQIDSLTPLWNGADWMEREVFDLMGIKFIGHPNLIKILTADELEGHPLRKDFPLTYEVPQFTWNLDDPPEIIK